MKKIEKIYFRGCMSLSLQSFEGVLMDTAFFFLSSLMNEWIDRCNLRIKDSAWVSFSNLGLPFLSVPKMRTSRFHPLAYAGRMIFYISFAAKGTCINDVRRFLNIS